MRKVTFFASILALALVAPFAIGDDKGEVAPGSAAPDFSLQDQDGKDHKLSDLKGKLVVLEWTNPECPFVVRHYKEKTMETLASKYASKGVVWLAINSTKHATKDGMKAWIKEHSLSYPILDDSSGTVGHTYGAKTTPHMFVIDKDGKVAYAGGVDDDAAGKNKDKVNFVQKALDELLEGKPVSTPSSKPYGCGVKYAKP
jgi:peroxiredoxin